MKDLIVNPDLYSKDYFLRDNEGWREYEIGLDNSRHPKFERALELANPSQGDNILDVGCGRGELLYYCARRGAKALGLDYSKAAVCISKDTINMLPPDIRRLVRVDMGDVAAYNFQEKFDVIFMIEIIEHMHDWQLARTFDKIKEILTKSGRLIIMTPNYYYEKYLSPLKRIMNVPLNMIKYPVRVLKGKYKPNDLCEAINKIFRIKADRGELGRSMHVNISTPGRLKRLLSDFDARVWCEDNSKNVLSLISRKWCGREIVAVAKRAH